MDAIYFSVNNWDETGAPDSTSFNEWLLDSNLSKYFGNKEWIAKNDLIVVEMGVDMSVSFIVSAPKDWVEKHCPEIIGSEFDCTQKYIDGSLEIKELDGKRYYLDPIWWAPIIEYVPDNIGKLYIYYWGDEDKLKEL